MNLTYKTFDPCKNIKIDDIIMLDWETCYFTDRYNVYHNFINNSKDDKIVIQYYKVYKDIDREKEHLENCFFSFEEFMNSYCLLVNEHLKYKKKKMIEESPDKEQIHIIEIKLDGTVIKERYIPKINDLTHDELFSQGWKDSEP